MKRRALLICISFCVLVVAALLFTRFFGPSTPQLQLLGFTNAAGLGPMATLCFSNSAHHAVYLSGPTNGSPFFSREMKTATGWQAAEVPKRAMTNFYWKVAPEETCAFEVPVLTNQLGGWRVTVRYFDGRVITALPVVHLTVPLPSQGSGRYLDVSSAPITQNP